MTYDASLIGTSGIGELHGNSYESVEGIDLVAVADVEEELLVDAGERWGIPESQRYLDHRTMLAEESVDVVSVATPSYFHHEHVMDAVDSPADPDVVWCEKPIALSVADGEEMVTACEESDVDLVINHSRRFHDPYVELRSLIRSGDALGDLLTVHGGFSEELFRNGTHSLDLVNFLCGLRAETVSGYLTGSHGMAVTVPERLADRYDDSGGGGIVVTKDGAYVNVDHTKPRKYAAGGYTLTGTNGKLVVNESRGEWQYWQHGDDGATETPLGSGFEDIHPISQLFDNAVDHLVDLLDGAATNRSPGREATDVLEVLVGLFVSHYTGSRVSIPLDRPLRDVTITSW